MDVHILSGGLTVVTILLAIVVMVKWQSATKDALFKRTKLTSVQWLIVGVWFAFLGQTVDNIYWLIAWTSHHFSNHGAVTLWLFENGVSFNNIFRSFHFSRIYFTSKQSSRIRYSFLILKHFKS